MSVPASAAFAVVVPTVGRPSLNLLLATLAAGTGPRPERIVLVDDRPPHDPTPLPAVVPDALRDRVEVVPGRGAGPAAARNTGWRATDTPWVVFLDDDVVPGPGWAPALVRDLTHAAPDTAGVQARITVPLPADRRPTDWERTTAGLATAQWITADMAYRRAALADVGGFDERFPRAFREDADLALRVRDAGWSLTIGERRTTHPVRPADDWVSVRTQAGNADDVLMNRLHGPGWWARAGAPRGRLPRHVAVTAAGLLATASAARRRPWAALGWGAVWLAGTAEFAAARILPGPRTRDEVRRMAVTSVLIPPVATAHWLRAVVRYRVRPKPFDPANSGNSLVHD
ncbi:glycosyltransferase [Streptomyces sp. RFCAC02]|uniref:glycosyltransferase family 2 protein n=1 Tax=Streptomyces sp. RFCAC02 TaxID=2499143 RepID=UPI001020069B|nr:glycosyltransferase [Streptomyces sp. RFCAC02]